MFAVDVEAVPALVVTFGVTLLIGWAAVRWGPSLGYIDLPDDPTLKVHIRPAVPLGGVAVATGTCVGLALVGSLSVGFFGAGMLLVGLGLIDDRIKLSPVVRLIFEVVAGIILVSGTVGLADGWMGAVFGVGLVIVSVNAVNLLDGLDGLAGSVGLVTAVAASVLAAVRSEFDPYGLIVAAALAAFLFLNWHPSRLFLGDNGAYFVGLGLATALLRTSPGPVGFPDLLAVLLLGVFGLDMAVSIVRRVRAGQPPFLGDRDHLYDRLRRAGVNVPGVVGVAAAVQTILAVIVIVGEHEFGAAAAFAAAAMLYVILVIGLTVAPSPSPARP